MARKGTDDTEVRINLTAKDNASNVIKQLAQQTKSLQKSIEGLNKTVGQLATAQSNAAKEQKKASDTSKKAGEASNDAAKQTEKTANKTDKATKSTNKYVKATNKLLKSIGRIAVYRAIRSFISFLTKGIEENIQLMAQMDDSVNNTMSKFNSNAKVTQASMAVIALPFYDLANFVLPTLAKVLAEVAETFSILRSAIKGEETYLKVNTKYWEDYAASIEEAKNQRFSFDQFNSLSSQKTLNEDLFIKTPRTEEDTVEEIKNVLQFASAIGVAGLAITELLGKFKEKDEGLKNQTSLTDTETQSVLSWAGALETLLGKIGTLLGVAGLAGLLGKLGELGRYGKDGDTPIDIPIGVGIPEGALAELSALNDALADTSTKWGELPDLLNAKFGDTITCIENLWGQNVAPLPARFTTLYSTSLLHFGQEARGELQAINEAASSYFKQSADSMYTSYKTAIDDVVNYMSAVLGGGDVVVEGNAGGAEVKAPIINKGGAYSAVDLQATSPVTSSGKTSWQTGTSAQQGFVLTYEMTEAFWRLIDPVEKAKTSFKNLIDVFDGTEKSWKNAIELFVKGIGALVGGTLGVPAFAGGGIAESGTIFRAGESGAEVVSYLGGGQTGVMNIAQFEEASYRGVSRALYDNRGIFEQEIHGDVYMNGDRVGKVAASGVYKEGVRVGYFEKK